MYLRNAVVKLAQSWVGLKEADGSYKKIIDIYNSKLKTFPRGVKMKYSWAWCACTWSALALELGYEKIMPIEISCAELIKLAVKMNIWQENDGYVPLPGDGIVYDWEDSGIGDNTGNPDHIGTVEYVNKAAGYFVVIEGNYGDAVKRRTMSINGKYIRGFITPRYDNETDLPQIQTPTVNGDLKTIAHEVIAGKWGSGAERKQMLANHGYNYYEVQKEVNRILNGSAVTSKDPVQDQNQPIKKKVTATCKAALYQGSIAGTYQTTSDLYCRNDAGTNKKALCLIPKGTKVQCYGYYSKSGNANWLYIQFTMDGVQYTGFSSSAYLKKI